MGVGKLSALLLLAASGCISNLAEVVRGQVADGLPSSSASFQLHAAEANNTEQSKSSRQVSLLLTVLVSSNLPLLRIVLATVQDQAPHSLDVRIVLIVNSKIEGFFESVLQEHGGSFEVVQTWSNGRPGVGHNACIRFFRDKSQEDYLYVLDGDDFLYTTAFLIIAHIIRDLPFDVVLLSPADKLVVLLAENRLISSRSADNRVRIRLEHTYKIEIADEERWGRMTLDDGTGRAIQTMYDIFAVGGLDPGRYGTVFRSALWSRHGVQAAPDPLYDEDMFANEDLSPQLWALEKYLASSEDVRVRVVVSTHLLLYNAVNPFSITGHTTPPERTQHDNAILFQKYQSRYASIWQNGTFLLSPLVMHDPVKGNPAFMRHKEEFLAKYSPLLQEYLEAGNPGARRVPPLPDALSWR